MTSAHDGCSSPCNVCSPGPVSEVRAVESAGFPLRPRCRENGRNAELAARSPRLGAGGRDGTAGLDLILGAGQSLAGSAGQRGRLATRCPRATSAESGRREDPGWPRAASPALPLGHELLERLGVRGQCSCLSRTPPSPGSFVPQFPRGEAGGGRRAGQARGSSPGSAKPYYFPTTVSSSLLIKLDPAVHNSH